MSSHWDEKNRPRMVNVGGKAVTHRTARARAALTLPAPVLKLLARDDIRAPKGPVFQTAIIAGTMAAKKTSELIPLCHPLRIEDCKIEIRVEAGEALIECRVEAHDKTGVEMEALTGATVAALTVYDMCKGISRDMVIREVRLIGKTGGKSDFGARRSEMRSRGETERRRQRNGPDVRRQAFDGRAGVKDDTEIGKAGVFLQEGAHVPGIR